MTINQNIQEMSSVLVYLVKFVRPEEIYWDWDCESTAFTKCLYLRPILNFLNLTNKTGLKWANPAWKLTELNRNLMKRLIIPKQCVKSVLPRSNQYLLHVNAAFMAANFCSQCIECRKPSVSIFIDAGCCFYSDKDHYEVWRSLLTQMTCDL